MSMRILARCYDRVLVAVAGREVGLVKLGNGAEDRNGALVGTPDFEKVDTIDCEVEAVIVHRCQGCPENYGPKGSPPGGGDMFQQFALLEGSHPWGRPLGWYCMGCSMPPR